MKPISSVLTILILISLSSNIFADDTKNVTAKDPDALALYKGIILEKVFENWRDPLGPEYDKKVIVSFKIFPHGNIDRPAIKESSQLELLDNLALRAISESAPFPKFPETLDFSNLNITIHFKYIPGETLPAKYIPETMDYINPLEEEVLLTKEELLVRENRIKFILKSVEN